MARKGAGSNVNFWGMLRDVLLAAISKGQLLLALGGLIIIFIILVMPSVDVSKLIFEILHDLEHGSLIGLFFSPGLLGGWFFHARWQRRQIAKDMERIGKEKSQLQELLLPGKIKSSEL